VDPGVSRFSGRLVGPVRDGDPLRGMTVRLDVDAELATPPV
jgi:hypothetical protein